MKKLMAFLMAMVMLALPVASLAEDDFITAAVKAGKTVETTVAFEAGEIDVIAADLLNALSVMVTAQGSENKQVSVRLNISGSTILSVDVAKEGNDLYERTNILGDQVYLIADGDGQINSEKAMNLLSSLGMPVTADSSPMVQLDVQKMANSFDPASLEKVIDTVKTLKAEADPSELPEGVENIKKTVAIEMTADEMVALYDAAFDALKDNAAYMEFLESMIASMGAEMTTEKMFEMMKQSVNDGVREAIKEKVRAVVCVSGDETQETTVLSLDVDGSRKLTVTVASRVCEPMESIVTEDALRLAALTDEELMTWVNGAFGSVQVWAMTALQSLPASVLSALFGGM